jgi:putative spermidine/putrescine transport system substrate-binding protein
MTDMKHDNDFVRDCLSVLREKTQGKLVHRRRFLGALAMLGVAPAGLRLTRAHAASDELVVVNWGGDALETYEKAWVGPFNAGSNGKAILDGSGPSSGRIKAMVESGAVVWDVCDRNLPASIELGREDLLEKVDWNVVDPAQLRDIHRSDWGVGSYLYSFVLTWDSEALTGKPANWADFWNVKDVAQQHRGHARGGVAGRRRGSAGRLSHRRRAGLRQDRRDQGAYDLLDQRLAEPGILPQPRGDDRQHLEHPRDDAA